MESVEGLVTHAVSDTISPVTPRKPNFDAAMAAAAMVFTLFGAMGQSSATEPWNKTRLPSPSVQSVSRPAVRRKQEGCLDIRMESACERDPYVVRSVSGTLKKQEHSFHN